MAFMKQINELTGILFLMLFGFPLIASTNIDCNGKAFHCVNSTHFMICVDLGGGVSSTVDDFVISCPPPTVCQGKNRFECEFPAVTTPLPTLRESEATTLPWEDIITTTFPKNTSESDHSDIKTLNTVSSSTLPENRVTLMPMDTDKNGTKEVATNNTANLTLSTESIKNNETLKLNETSTFAYGTEKIPETNMNFTHSIQVNQNKFNEAGNSFNTNTSTSIVNYTTNVPIIEIFIKNTTNLTAESPSVKDKTTVSYDTKLDYTVTTLFKDYTTNFTTTVPNNIMVTENYIAENTNQTEASTIASLKVDELNMTTNIISSVNQNSNQHFNKNEFINQTIDAPNSLPGTEPNINQVGDIFQSQTLSTSTPVIEKQTITDFSKSETQVKPMINTTLEYGTYTSPTDMLHYDTININKTLTNQPSIPAGEIMTTEIIIPEIDGKVTVGKVDFPFFLTTQPSMPIVETNTVINNIASKINSTLSVTLPQDLNKTESIILPEIVQEMKISITDSTDTKIYNTNVVHQTNNENTLASVLPIETQTASSFSPSIIETTTWINTFESRIDSTSTDTLPQELFLNKTEPIWSGIVQEKIIATTDNTVTKTGNNPVLPQSLSQNTVPSIFPIEKQTTSDFLQSKLDITTVITISESEINGTSTDTVPQDTFLNKTETIFTNMVEETLISQTENTVPKPNNNNVVPQSTTENTLPSVLPNETQTPGFSQSKLETTTVITTLESKIDSTSTDTLSQERILNKTEPIWSGVVQVIATTDNTVTKIGNHPVLPQSSSQNTVPSIFPIENQTTSDFLQSKLDITTVITIPESGISGTSTDTVPQDIFLNKTETIFTNMVEETLISPTENTVPKLSNNNVVPQSTTENTLPSVLPIETQTPGFSQSKLETTTVITTLGSRIDSSSTDTLSQERILNKTEPTWSGVVQQTTIATTDNTVTKIGNHPVLPQSSSQNTVPSIFPIEKQTTSDFLQSKLDITTVITISKSGINGTSTDTVPQDTFFNKTGTIFTNMVEETLISPTENTVPKPNNNNVVPQSTTENTLPSVLPIETQTLGFSQSKLETTTVITTLESKIDSTSTDTLSQERIINKTEPIWSGVVQVIATTDNTVTKIGNHPVLPQSSSQNTVPSIFPIEKQTTSDFLQSKLDITTVITIPESGISGTSTDTVPQDIFLNKTETIFTNMEEETLISPTENTVPKLSNNNVVPQSTTENTLPSVLPIETQTPGFSQSKLETTTVITTLDSRIDSSSTDTLSQERILNKTEPTWSGVVQQTTIATTDNTVTKIGNHPVLPQSSSQNTVPSIFPIEKKTTSDFLESKLDITTVITISKSGINCTSTDTVPQDKFFNKTGTIFTNMVEETLISPTENTVPKPNNNNVVPQSTTENTLPSVLPIETQTLCFSQSKLETTTVITTLESKIDSTSTDTLSQERIINKTEPIWSGVVQVIATTDNTVTKIGNHPVLPQSSSQNTVPSIFPIEKQTTSDFLQSKLDITTVITIPESGISGTSTDTVPQDIFLNKTETIFTNMEEETLISPTENTVPKLSNNNVVPQSTTENTLPSVLPIETQTPGFSQSKLETTTVITTLDSRIDSSSTDTLSQERILNKTEPIWSGLVQQTTIATTDNTVTKIGNHLVLPQSSSQNTVPSIFPIEKQTTSDFLQSKLDITTVITISESGINGTSTDTVPQDMFLNKTGTIFTNMVEETLTSPTENTVPKLSNNSVVPQSATENTLPSVLPIETQTPGFSQSKLETTTVITTLDSRIDSSSTDKLSQERILNKTEPIWLGVVQETTIATTDNTVTKIGNHPVLPQSSSQNTVPSIFPIEKQTTSDFLQSKLDITTVITIPEPRISGTLTDTVPQDIFLNKTETIFTNMVEETLISPTENTVPKLSNNNVAPQSATENTLPSVLPIETQTFGFSQSKLETTTVITTFDSRIDSSSTDTLSQERILNKTEPIWSGVVQQTTIATTDNTVTKIGNHSVLPQSSSQNTVPSIFPIEKQTTSDISQSKLDITTVITIPESGISGTSTDTVPQDIFLNKTETIFTNMVEETLISPTENTVPKLSNNNVVPQSATENTLPSVLPIETQTPGFSQSKLETTTVITTLDSRIDSSSTDTLSQERILNKTEPIWSGLVQQTTIATTDNTVTKIGNHLVLPQSSSQNTVPSIFPIEKQTTSDFLQSKLDITTVITISESGINGTSTDTVPQDMFLNKTGTIFTNMVEETLTSPTENTVPKLSNNSVVPQSATENTLPSVLPIETQTPGFSQSKLETTTVITTLDSRIDSSSTDKLSQERILNKTEPIWLGVVQETTIATTDNTVTKIGNHPVLPQSSSQNTVPSIFPIEKQTTSDFLQSKLYITTVITIPESEINGTSTDTVFQDILLNKTETIFTNMVEETLISPTENTVPKLSNNNVVPQITTENTSTRVLPIETQTPGFSQSKLETTTVITTLESKIDSTSTKTLSQERIINKTEPIWSGVVQETTIATTDNTVTKIGNHPVLPQSSIYTVSSIFPIEKQTTSDFLQSKLDITTVITIPESGISGTSTDTVPQDIFLNKTPTTSPTESIDPKHSNNNVLPQSTTENTLPSVLPIETQTSSGFSQRILETTTVITTFESRIDSTSTATLPQELILNKTESILPGIVPQTTIATTENTVTKIGSHPVLPQSTSQNTEPSVFPIETKTTSDFLQSKLDTTTLITIPEYKINGTSTDTLPQDIIFNKTETIFTNMVEETLKSPSENKVSELSYNNVVPQITIENTLPSVLPIETQTPSGFSQSILEPTTVIPTLEPRISNISTNILPQDLFLNKSQSISPDVVHETTIPNTGNTVAKIGNHPVLSQSTRQNTVPSVLPIETQTTSGFLQSILETVTVNNTTNNTTRMNVSLSNILHQDLNKTFIQLPSNIVPDITTKTITETTYVPIGEMYNNAATFVSLDKLEKVASFSDKMTPNTNEDVSNAITLEKTYSPEQNVFATTTNYSETSTVVIIPSTQLQVSNIPVILNTSDSSPILPTSDQSNILLRMDETTIKPAVMDVQLSYFKPTGNDISIASTQIGTTTVNDATSTSPNTLQSVISNKSMQYNAKAILTNDTKDSISRGTDIGLMSQTRSTNFEEISATTLKSNISNTLINDTNNKVTQNEALSPKKYANPIINLLLNTSTQIEDINVSAAASNVERSSFQSSADDLLKEPSQPTGKDLNLSTLAEMDLITTALPLTGPILQKETTSYKIGSLALISAQENYLVDKLKPIPVTNTKTPKLYNTTQIKESDTESASKNTKNIVSSLLDVSPSEEIAKATKKTSSKTYQQKTIKVTPKPQNVTPKYTVPVNTNIKINDNPQKSSTNVHYTCRNRRRGRYADNTDCRKFYICIGRETPITGLCPNNTVFSEIKTQCTRTLSHCIRDNQFKCVTEGRFGDFLKPNVYYICVKNKLDSFVRFKFQCQNGYYLNKTSVRCLQNSKELSRSISNDSISEKTIEKKSKEDSRSDSRKEFECEKEGKFPDPNNCRGYYVCTKSKNSEEFRRRKKRCDSEEMFNKKKKKCVEADSDECSK